MGRYPFLTRLSRYVEEFKPYKAGSTLFQEERTLKRIHRIFQDLHAQGKVSTTEPKKLTEADIGAFVLEVKSKSLDVNTIAKYAQYLKVFLTWCGNPAMATMHARKQLPKPNYNKELSCLTEEEVQSIILHAKTIDGWQGEVLGFIIPTYYYTGMRPSELRKAHLEDVDLAAGRIRVRHPKGEASWGVKRSVPIAPPLRQTMVDYLDARERRLKELKMNECVYLVPNLSRFNETGKPYTGQSLLRMKYEVEARSGIKFELRKLRNTCGQHLKDKGVPIEAISKLLGHASTITTEKHYARMRDSHAFSLVENAWALKPIASIEPAILENPCQSMPVQKKPELNFSQ